MQSRITPDFLADLDVVCPKANSGNLPWGFIQDLGVVYPHALTSSLQQSVLSMGDLTFLAEQLEGWRTRQQLLLKQYLDRVPPDDPLFCPVSLFGTMDYGRLETAHTRALAWLLGKREHGFDFKLLEALLGHLQGRKIHVIGEIKVESEYLIQCGPSGSDTGRIDVFAEGHWEESGKESSWILIIEAKIDAEEGEEQLSKYEYWLKQFSRSKEVIPVFLTPKGRQPKTSLRAWKVMSFVELASILRRVSGLEDLPGFHFLRYYLAGVLKNVCQFSNSISPDCENPYKAIDYLQLVLGIDEVEYAHGQSW